MNNRVKQQHKDTNKVVENSTNSEILFTFGGKNKVFTQSKNCVPNQKINLLELIQLIKSDAPRNALKVRELVKTGFENGINPTEIKKQIKPFKNSLQFVLLSGFCPLHHNDNDLIYNGCLQLDMDFKFTGGYLKALMLKDKIKDFPFIIFSAISPSGYGLKCLVATDNNDINLHGKVSKATINYLSNILNIDKKYFDNLGASQPCFIPFDKDVYFNPNYTNFETFKALYKMEQQERKELEKIISQAQNLPLKTNFDNSSTVPTIETLKYLTNQITGRNIDITHGYNDWFAIACSYATCGENGRGLFHSVASLNSEYDFNKNDNKYNEALKAKFNNIGLLVNRCKSYGITINDFCKEWIKNNSLVIIPKPKSTGIEKDFLLNKNQFIGNVLTARNFKKGINILTGGTGVGKSNFVANGFDKVVIVSRNIATLENYNQYGFGRFLQSDKKDSFIDLQDGSKITVTYKSLEKLLNSTIDLDNHVFVFDEYHLLTDAYKDVRKETQFTYDVLTNLQESHTVILSSANDIFISDPKLIIQNKFTFKKPSVNRDVNVTYYANFTQLQKLINKRLQEGKKILLYTNRKEDNNLSEKIKNSFPNNSYLFFDATKHGTVDLTNLEHDITVCTKALTTGKDIKNNDLAVIIYCNDYDMKRSVINQFFGRARNYQTASFDLLFTFKSNHKKYNSYDVNKLFYGCKNIAKSVISASVNDIAFLHENEKHFVLKQDNKLIINYFSIDNHIENSISKYTIRNTTILSEFLKLHGYKPTIYEITEQESEIKPKETKISNSDKYVQEIELMINNETDNHSFKTNAQNRVLELQKIGFSKNESLLYALRYDSSMKWKRLLNLFLSEIRLNTNDLSYQRDYKKALAVFGNDYLTTGEILEKIHTLRKTSTNLGRDIGFIKTLDKNEKTTGNSTLKLLSKYFDIQMDRNKYGRIYKVCRTDFLTTSQRKTIHENDMKKLFKLTQII